MRIYRDPAEIAGEGPGRAVTIGAFDGVHLGHQAVLRLVRDLARARGLSATVLTFDRHPAEVVRPGSAPKLLTTLDQKLDSIRCYATQFPPAKALTFDRMRAIALHHGMAAGFSAGETFTSPRTLGTRDLMQFLAL